MDVVRGLYRCWWLLLLAGHCGAAGLVSSTHFVDLELHFSGRPERLQLLLQVGFYGRRLRVSALRSAVESAAPGAGACLRALFASKRTWLENLTAQFAIDESRPVVE